MTLSIALFVAASSISPIVGKRSQVGFSKSLDVGAQPALRSDLTPCPCTIWRHCSTWDIMPDTGEQGVACVASEDAVISMGHQVQCVPARHGGLNYYCPPILSHKCDPGAQCIETELSSCSDFECEGPEWLTKERTAPFCAMTDCTHAECCDRGATLVTAAPEAPSQPQELTSCADRINALAEPTLERIGAYVGECGFNAGDVNYGAGEFELTTVGRIKLWEEHCQHVPALQDSPDDVLADAQALQTVCQDARLQAQMSSVGIFATAAALDHVWRAAPGRPAPVAPKNDDVVLPPVPIEVLPPAPAPVARLTTIPPTAAPTTAAPDSCVGTFTFTLQIGHRGDEHEQTFILGHAPEGKQESLQCDAGPYKYGTLNMMCQNGQWVMSSNSNPCSTTPEGATQSGGGTSGQYMPASGHVLRLVDVTAIVDRLHHEDKDSTMKCCCNARLDASLGTNRWSHRRWNSREHTGICTVYANIRSCSRTNRETHSHWRTEGAQCIVREDAEANWRPILRLDHPASSRPITPNVPTLSSQTADEYENCVPAHSVGECERCTHNVHCPEGWYCCPYMKLCVQNAQTQCPSSLVAGCSNCMQHWKPNPEQCEGSCHNAAFPRTWLPACS